MDMADIGNRQANLVHHTMRNAGLQLYEVWMYYFSIGGEVGEMEVEAYLHHALALPTLQRDMLAHAVNELIDSKPIARAPYTEDLVDSDGSDPDEGHDESSGPGRS